MIVSVSRSDLAVQVVENRQTVTVEVPAPEVVADDLGGSVSVVAEATAVLIDAPVQEVRVQSGPVYSVLVSEGPVTIEGGGGSGSGFSYFPGGWT